MKVCGWKDLKTMQRYIRMAGIDEQGATNSLMLLGDEEESPRKPATPAAQKSVDLEALTATRVTASGEELSTEAHDETADNQVMNKVVSIFDFKARR
jgi:hypothetical protein